MSRSRKAVVLIVLFCCILGTSVGQATEAGFDTVGFRAGADLMDGNGSHKGNFDMEELFAYYRLPWYWSGSFAELRTRLDASAGALRRAGESGFIATLGPGLALEIFSATVEIDAGVSGTYLGRHDFPGRDLGGPFLFNIHTGIGAYPFRHIGIGYHFEHLSNSNIYGCNPGVNLQMLELKYRF